jgi:hypothetical protein
VATIAPPPPGRGCWPYRSWVLLAFAVPAAIVWAGIGLALAALLPQETARWAAVAYATVYGILEVVGRRGRAPTTRWQVPAPWVRHRHESVNVLVWGALLGPGLLTRNPYASIWMLALLLASLGHPPVAAAVGAGAGLVHGGSRALGVLRELRPGGIPDYSTFVARGITWRVADGATLVAVAALVATARG